LIVSLLTYDLLSHSHNLLYFPFHHLHDYCFFTVFILMNFGPQHPSTHGVLRLITILHGETFLWILPEIGLLCRATEKLIEYNSYNASISYFDRLDYVSTISQEALLLNSVERLIKGFMNDYCSTLRIILLEISRIINHLLTITTHAIDIGAFNPMLWAFEEREKLLHVQESLSGSRMHTAFTQFPISYSLYDFTLSALRYDFPLRLLSDIYYWLMHFPIKMKEIHTLLTLNRIFQDRLHEVGIIDRDTCSSSGLSGVLSRAVGNSIDGRLSNYESYKSLTLNILLCMKGDCLDRYLIRINECLESIKLITQLIHRLPYLSLSSLYCLPNSLRSLRSSNAYSPSIQSYLTLNKVSINQLGILCTIQSMIHNFNSALISLFLFFSFSFFFQECPKGLYSIFLFSNGLDRPFRVDFTPNDFLTVTLLNKFCRNINLADLIAVLTYALFVLLPYPFWIPLIIEHSIVWASIS
jgi:NADH-quinone oxidoreductase subunit D